LKAPIHPRRIRRLINKEKPTQTGANTHHQDQSIVSVNLRAMKTTVRRPTDPTPPEDELDDELLITITLGHA